MNERQKLNDLLAQRGQHLAAAQEALNKGDQPGYKDAMGKVTALNSEIDPIQAVVTEMDRYAAAGAPAFGSGRKDMEEMGKLLAAHQPVKLDLAQHFGSLRQDSTTLATGTLVQPQGAGSEIRDGFAGQTSSLIDQVRTENLEGMGAYEEPYVVSDMEAQGGKVATLAGTARTASDPTFAKAKIAPYEVDVTSYVDRNLGRLNPADYAAKIQTMALRALRRKINGLIVNGDGQASPDMYGITTAKNTAGAAIYSSVALGALRGTNEKQRLYKISPDAGNANTGRIEDGGTIVPYTIVSGVGDSKLLYGDPANYLLALFGQYVIRVDESVKAVERMNAILGDAFVGGNLVVDKGFVVGTISGT